MLARHAINLPNSWPKESHTFTSFGMYPHREVLRRSTMFIALQYQYLCAPAERHVLWRFPFTCRS